MKLTLIQGGRMSHARTSAWCEEAASSLADDVCDDAPSDTELADKHALEGRLLALDATGHRLDVPPALLADARLSAAQRLVLAALEERAKGGREARMVESEIVARLSPVLAGVAMSDDRAAVSAALSGLVTRYVIGPLVGGGFLLRGRAVA